MNNITATEVLKTSNEISRNNHYYEISSISGVQVSSNEL